MLSWTVLCRHVIVCDPGKLVGCTYPVPSPTTLAFDTRSKVSAFPTFPTLRFPWGRLISGLHYRSLSLQPANLLASLSELTRGFPPANGDFYFRAFSGLITRTAAGYNYSGNWASSTGWTFTS